MSLAFYHNSRLRSIPLVSYNCRSIVTNTNARQYNITVIIMTHLRIDIF